jgi:hypothetical protein
VDGKTNKITLRVLKMEMDLKLQKIIYIKDNFTKEKNTEKVKFNIEMVLYMKVNSFKIIKMVKENNLTP